MLIKVVKLLGSLSPLEPRLAKKLTEPLCDIITTTPAKSLLYECVNTLLAGEMRSKSVIRLCLDKLRGFIEDPDQNLKYLGLLGLHKLMRRYPRVVSEHRDLILSCLQDEDVTIRMRALDLITSMVNQRNVVAIVRRMSDHLQQSEGVYREHVLQRILQIGAQDNYSYIVDFEWYISVLVELTHLTGASLHNARAITHQLTDVSIRVPGVRRYAVAAMCDVLLAGRLLTASGANNCMSEVLHAAAFIVGEFSEYVTEHVEVIRCMMRPEVGGLSGETQNVFVQSVMKVLAAGLYQPYNQQGEDRDVSMEVKVQDLLGRRHQAEAEDEKDRDEEEGDEWKEQSERPAQSDEKQPASSQAEDADPEQEEEELDENGVKKRKAKSKRRTYHEYATFVGEMLECLYTHLPLFCRSSHVEVQERAVSYHELVSWIIQHAQMQPFISVKVESRSSKPSAGSAPTSELADADKAGSSTSTALDLLDDSSASAAGRVSSSAPLPPAATLSSLAVQLCLLFSERLNPVNPKAQRKVPVPKGLDLNQRIHDGWDVDSDASLSEAEESDDSDGADRGGRRKGRQSKDSRRKDKGSKHADSAAERRKKRSGGLYSDEEYNAPQTAEEKAAAKRRLEDRKQAQLNNPFYLGDKKAADATSAAAGAQREDGGARKSGSREEPSERDTAQLDSDKGRKKSRKHRGDADDDIFAGVGDSKPTKVYRVQRVEDMPSDAVSSEEERKREKAQKKKTKSSRDDREKPSRDKKHSKGDKGARKVARGAEEEEKDGRVEDVERDKEAERKRKKDRRDAADDAKSGAMDELDPRNDGGSRAPSSDKKKKRSDKERDKESRQSSAKDREAGRERDRERDGKRDKKKRSEA